jgi:sRNA-binding protein
MNDPRLEAVEADVKPLKARIAALEKLLERILRQKPVSEKQLERALRNHGAGGTDLAGA